MDTFFQWYYYICRRDKSEEWKCQPYKWLSPELERHEMILGISSLVLTNTVTALFSTYLLNGCYSMVYYGFDEYGWFWWFLQWPIIYVVLVSLVFLLFFYKIMMACQVRHDKTVCDWLSRIKHENVKLSFYNLMKFAVPVDISIKEMQFNF